MESCNKAVKLICMLQLILTVILLVVKTTPGYKTYSESLV